MQKTPIHHLLDLLPEDKSFIELTTEIGNHIALALKMQLSTNRVIDIKTVKDFLTHLADNGIITLRVDNVNNTNKLFIKRNYSGYKTRES